MMYNNHMEAIIGGKIQTFNVTSVVLEHNPELDNIFLMYHCWRCGEKIAQFSATVTMMVPGALPASPIFSPVPIIELCRRCKQRHLLNSIV